MHLQYPPNVEYIYSYIESRGGTHPYTVFFGLQAFIKEYLLSPITQDNIDEAAELWAAHGEPFNREGWQYILDNHGGHLPVEIKAVQEGTPVPVKNVLVSVINTDPKCFWLTTYLETALLRAIWYSTTVATNSHVIKQNILKNLQETGTPEDVYFKLHDFGARGSHSLESSALGGMAHLVNFRGTDTIAAVRGARRFYNEPVAGFSIPAAEHSTITSWGRDREADAYRNMLQQFASTGALFAVVSDSYDIYNAVEHIWGDKLREEVKRSGATLVVRPDSGDPVEVVLKCVSLLDSKFGSDLNEKGYKVLRSVRVIQGDGIDAHTIEHILAVLKQHQYSGDNIAFGMGGALLGAPQRDDQKFALKCSAAQIDGQWVDVYKDPVTDTGKRSKRGRLKLVKHLGQLCTVSHHHPQYNSLKDELQTVYRDGALYNETCLSEVRLRSENTLAL